MPPFLLRGWQQDIIKATYAPTGKRPRQGRVSMPRGNGKTSLAAALALYALLADDEPSAQVLVVASDDRQARITFNMARRMIELDERLAEQIHIYSDRLYVTHNDSTLYHMPAEPGALQGHDPTLTIVDELHVVTERVWEAVSLAAGQREQTIGRAHV